MIFATYLILNVTKTNLRSSLLTVYSIENIHLNAWEFKFGQPFHFSVNIFVTGFY